MGESGMSFTEAKLEQAIIELLGGQGFPYVPGGELNRAQSEVLIEDDLRQRYQAEAITAAEIESVINRLDRLPAADLYDSNRTIHHLVADGFLLKREDRSRKDLYVQLIDYSRLPEQRLPQQDDVETLDGSPSVSERQAGYGDGNLYKLVNQLEIEGRELRIPDAILYINGLPLVVFEFKSAVRPRYSRVDEVQRPVCDQRWC